ncbi:CPBP family intramembrane glutamic endopeptidase [Petrocella sp. FN5]|uniref:CPBP family intramembrane glutamic endopeptidase n=1 Tax=Petrocella sp. FN5 TaxID=3032002 RepID=UPI0023DA518E|nr:type II CAAX endopeptidase family protein [Petrocella sp. FN5]MDF1618264.1 type II CAAX endopeptidase family protein [Petrocella sp. FN5]
MKIKITIIAYTLFVMVFLYIIEQVLYTPYLIKTLIKLPLFLLLPMALYKYDFKIKWSMKLNKSDIPLISFWSVLVFLTIMVAFYFVRPLIGMDDIVADISGRMAVSKNEIVFVGIYTIVVNAFIEELFFRGFIFQGLVKAGWHRLAYIFSALVFALYHVSNFRTWFDLWVMALALLGLFIGGIIFAYFVDRTKSFLASWLIHMSADIAIVWIGLHMFKII